ncbi:unnamed protein product [Caenorhabditis bovis]|uniref:PID domain-containing protein n=1 Tax=Caenorhabditis bovis TaxID=2654633 RepID=A0A8S1F238_9PELO|nr:unnamed protein product [Caenorhabditis bovis]
MSAVYLGVEEIGAEIQCKSSNRSLEEKLIEQIENQQLCGKIKRSSNDPKNEILIEISKFGLKIVHRKSSDVILRVPLLQLVVFTTFNDGYGKTNAIILESSEKRFKCHLVQFATDADASKMCKMVQGCFQEAEEARMLLDNTEPPSPSNPELFHK